MINSQPLGFYAPAQLIRDARQHDVTVLPIDINHSGWDCAIEEHPSTLRLGLRLVVGLPERYAHSIVAERTKPYRSVSDLAARTRLPTAELQRLARANALASLGISRRQAMWDALAADPRDSELPLWAGLPAEDEPPVSLPDQDPLDGVLTDYASTGLSLAAHPISFYREQLAARRVVSAESLTELRHGQSVRVGGLVILRQRPATAKGITFVTLEDETGCVNLVVRQKIWDRFYAVARRSPAWVASGSLQRKYDVTHVVVQRLHDFAEYLKSPASRGRPPEVKGLSLILLTPAQPMHPRHRQNDAKI